MGRARGARAVVSLVPLIPCHRARPPTSEARLGPPCHTWNGTGLADPQGQQAQEVGGNAVGRGGCAQKEGRRVFSTLQSSRVLAWARARTFTLTDMPTSKRKHATTQRTRMDSCLRTRTDTSTQSSTCRTDSTLRPHRQKGRGWMACTFSAHRRCISTTRLFSAESLSMPKLPHSRRTEGQATDCAGPETKEATRRARLWCGR